MNDRELRLECVRMAAHYIPGVTSAPTPDHVMDLAQKMFNFVWGSGHFPADIREPNRIVEKGRPLI